MTKEEILEGNRLLCDFIGLKIFNGVWDAGRVVPYEIVFNQSCVSDSEIGFNTAWDWLMPVVEKIEETSFEKIKSDYVPYTKHPLTVSLNYKYAKITVDNDYKLQNIHKEGIIFNEYNEESKIIACYKAVVEFIKWYNQNKLNETN